MSRRVASILVFLALLAQFAMGMLPPGQTCVCIQLRAAAPCCCCEDGDDGESGIVEHACPCQRGCERCLRVPTIDARATLGTRPRVGFRDLASAVAMLFGPARVLAVRPVLARGMVPRANESPPPPPHLGPLGTTRLTV